MKVKDIPYRRYTIEEGTAEFERFCRAYEAAQSADDVIAARKIMLDMRIAYETASALAFNRFSLDSRDPFYRAEVDYYDENGPLFSRLGTRFADMMLNCPFRPELEKRLNPRLFAAYEADKKAFDDCITEDVQKENATVTEYSQFMSSLSFTFDGEAMPLSVIRGKLEDSDPDVRRRAAVEIDRVLGEHKRELDDLYDRLVHLRDAMAKKMGYRDFTELGYWRMRRIDYTADMVRVFRDNVCRDLVPAVCEVKKSVAARLGVPTVTFADAEVYTAGTAPEPVLDKEGMFRAAQEMYDEMNPEIGAFMHAMQENEAFDVDARDGKWGGGYCTSFPLYKQPFILANFNGSSGDVDVLTHEFGHALADYFKYKEGDLELDVGGMETAECHSMSMEFFSWKYMHRFFGENTDKYLYKHLLSSFCFIPYGVTVDEFQHEVYAHPDMTPDERDAVWLRLEQKYRPWLDYTGLPYLGRGTRWQYQMHIYESPFYYIDYCLAQTVALSFLCESLSDYDGALNRYLGFVRTGGQKSFGDLVTEAGLPSPFAPGALAKMAQRITALAKDIEKRI